MKVFGLSIGRIVSVALKETRHIRRDPFTLALAIGFPMMLVVFFGYAIDFDVRNISIAIRDGDNTPSSRLLADSFVQSGYFSAAYFDSPRRVITRIDEEQERVGLIIERGFSKDFRAGRDASVQLLVDGADNTTAGVIIGYLSGIRRSAEAELRRRAGEDIDPVGVDIRSRFLFNPQLNSRWFIVPGLAVVALAVLGVLLTALTVAREWESGSMELLLSTPVRPIEIILGKIIPYLGLGLGAVVLVYIAARVGFGVPFRGSHFLFAFGCLLFITTSLVQGIFISVITRRQAVAMQAAMISGLLPAMLLSGFIFSVDSMPVFFRYFTGILPARWFMDISRGVFLRGANLIQLAEAFIALGVLCCLLIVLAVSFFKKDVEP